MENIYEELIVGYLAGELSPGQQQQLAEALRTDPLCRARYDELVKLYARSRTLAFEEGREENYLGLKKRLDESGRAPVFRRPLWPRLRKVAAAAAIVLMAGGLAYYIARDVSMTGRLQANEVTVPLGSQTRIVLPDQSVVWLNSGSILSYGKDFGQGRRKVGLVGEGYFEVTKDKRREFIVTSGDISVRVLGTKFNVKGYPDDNILDVSVLEGSVMVTADDSDDSFVLKPDQNLSYYKGSRRMFVTAVDAYKTAQWAEGKLCFVNTPLSDIMRSIERAYNVRIEVRSSRMSREHFSGSVSLGMTIDEILNYVDVDDKYTWNIDGNVITFSDR